MQKQNILPEVFAVLPDSQLEAVAHSAIKAGIKLIVVAGGDGTIDSIVGAMVGSSATLQPEHSNRHAKQSGHQPWDSQRHCGIRRPSCARATG